MRDVAADAAADSLGGAAAAAAAAPEVVAVLILKALWMPMLPMPRALRRFRGSTAFRALLGSRVRCVCATRRRRVACHGRRGAGERGGQVVAAAGPGTGPQLTSRPLSTMK
eukprot:362004-Chlamydomonas_euryale.AAC.14